eukprot:9366520-Pyramimonas_sp.AAC.1
MERGVRSGMRIADAWCVRVMLSVPTVATDTLVLFCSQFPVVATKTISSTSVCRAGSATPWRR